MSLRLPGSLGAALAVSLVLGVCRSRPGPASEEETEPSPVVGVQVAPIVRATLREYVDTWGSVEPEPVSGQRRPASARVAAPVAGLLSGVRCAEGERVSEGSVLFRLDFVHIGGEYESLGFFRDRDQVSFRVTYQLN